jgi:OmpA-OmpF porin, OOP family
MVRRRRQLAGDLRRFAAGSLGLLGTLALAGDAHAQALLERFEPAARGSRFFVADSLELDGSPRLATGVVTSYGTKLRTFRQAGADGERSDLVAHSLWLHPGASLVVTPGARFALDVPVAFQHGSDAALDRRLYGAPGSPRMGDVRGSFDLRLAGPDRRDAEGVLLAAGVVVWLPTGSASAYTSDDFARVGVRAAASVRAGPVLGAARVGYTYRKDELPPFGGVSLGSEANGVLALGYHGGPVVVGPELHGATILKDAFVRRSTPFELLVGAHLTVAEVQVGVGVGSALVAGLGAPRIRGVVSLEWTPSPASARGGDRDHDGVPDDGDICPDVPGLVVAPVGAVGCPAAPHDGDGDGVVDDDDACPDAAGVASDDPARRGCPLAPLPPPLTPPLVTPPAPAQTPPDGDGDGLSDTD